jgi:hypothetical protein
MKKALIIGASFLLPLVTSAQGITGILNNIIKPLGNIVGILIPIVFSLALLYFFWGLATYILSVDQDKEVAKKRMIWGIVALFVMSAVWGLVKFIQTNLGITETPTVPVPDISNTTGVTF